MALLPSTSSSLLAVPTSNSKRDDFENSRHPVEPAGPPSFGAMRLGIAAKESDTRLQVFCCIHHDVCEIPHHLVERRAFKWPPALKWFILRWLHSHVHKCEQFHLALAQETSVQRVRVRSAQTAFVHEVRVRFPQSGVAERAISNYRRLL